MCLLCSSLPVSQRSAASLAVHKISYKVSLILYSKSLSHFSTAPSQTKVLEKSTISLSLLYILSAVFANSCPAAGGLNLSPFRPSKQSPKYSHTLGAFYPLDKIVNKD